MQKYDAIIIGTGQAGPPLAARLVDAGMKVAVIERKSWRHLRQRWLHPDENPDRKRLCGEDRTPRH